MGSLDWGLEVVLVGLLAVTLVHAVRLERALRLMRNDRAALGDAIASFDSSARAAEAGIGRLHSASSDTAAMLAQRLEQGGSLRDDLAFLIQRGEGLADRLDETVRAARALPLPSQPAIATPAAVPALPASPAAPPKVRSQAERDLLLALQAAQ